MHNVLPNTVESLWTGCVREFYNCAKNVYNKDFVHLASNRFFSYAQLLHTNYTQLMNNILTVLTPLNKSYTHYPHSLLKLYIYIKENEQ